MAAMAAMVAAAPTPGTFSIQANWIECVDHVATQWFCPPATPKGPLCTSIVLPYPCDVDPTPTSTTVASIPTSAVVS